MNILEQYKKAVAERGNSGPVEIVTHVQLKIGETFEFGGYSWQRVGEKVGLVIGHNATPYGYAEIVSIDAHGFKTAKRTK
jgi:hypothetical protein